MERQAAAGVAEADSLLLVVDGQEGLTASDQEIVSWLRRKHPHKPLTLAVNKCENVRTADTQVCTLHPLQSIHALMSLILLWGNDRKRKLVLSCKNRFANCLL